MIFLFCSFQPPMLHYYAQFKQTRFKHLQYEKKELILLLKNKIHKFIIKFYSIHSHKRTLLNYYQNTAAFNFSSVYIWQSTPKPRIGQFQWLPCGRTSQAENCPRNGHETFSPHRWFVPSICCLRRKFVPHLRSNSMFPANCNRSRQVCPGRIAHRLVMAMSEEDDIFAQLPAQYVRRHQAMLRRRTLCKVGSKERVCPGPPFCLGQYRRGLEKSWWSYNEMHSARKVG